VKPRITQQNLEGGSGRGIALPICPDRLTQEHESHATIPL
jgi:hypothetical protein